MFVLLYLMNVCLQCVCALLPSMNRPLAPVKRAQFAMQLIVKSQTHPLANFHPPTLRRLN